MMYLAPSVLSADFSTLGNDIATVAAAGAPLIHLDVMDGKFVPNISFGAPVIASVRKVTNAIFDVHLMIEEPIRFLEDFVNAGADLITVHYEACKDLEKTITAIHKLGVKAGLAISPDTPVSVLEPFLKQIEMVLIMSVYPGFGGQKFIVGSLDRVRDVRQMMIEQGKQHMWLEVDGGIGVGNIARIAQAGANVFVAGSAVFRGDLAANIRELKDILESEEE